MHFSCGAGQAARGDNAAVARRAKSLIGPWTLERYLPVQKLASAFLYISQIFGCLIGNMQNRSGFSSSRGSGSRRLLRGLVNSSRMLPPLAALEGVSSLAATLRLPADLGGDMSIWSAPLVPLLGVSEPAARLDLLGVPLGLAMSAASLLVLPLTSERGAVSAISRTYVFKGGPAGIMTYARVYTYECC